MPKPITKRYDYQSHDNRNNRKRNDALSERCVKEAINLFNQQKCSEAWIKMAEAVTAGGVNAKIEFAQRAIRLMESPQEVKMMKICKKVFGDAFETKILPDLLQDAMQEKQAIAFYLMGRFYLRSAKDDRGKALQSIDCFKRAVELGHVESNADLGRMFMLQGDFKNAILHLEVEYKGKPGADYWDLYNIYNFKVGHIDKSKAFKYLKLAYEKNILEAKVAFPELLLSGDSTEEKRNEAFRILEENAKYMKLFYPLLIARNYKCLGDYYLKVENGKQKALEYYLLMLEPELPFFQIEYAKRILVEKHWGNNVIPHAIELMKGLLDTESAVEAYYILGMYYLSNSDPENAKIGREYVEKAAALGHLKANVNLAMYYEGNDPFPKDLAKSYAYICEANRIQELPDLLIWQGVCLEEGRGVDINLDHALEVYKKARVQGSLGGAFGEYALSLRMGKVREAELLKTLIERKLSVQLRRTVTIESLHPDQMTLELFTVQGLYLLGKYFESKEELEKSFALYFKIAKQSMYAQFRLGEQFWFGKGTKQDIPHAVTCFTHSRLNQPKANVYLEQYYDKLQREMEECILRNEMDKFKPKTLLKVFDEGRAPAFSDNALEKAYHYYKEKNHAIHERIFQFSLTREDPWALVIQGERIELNEDRNQQNLARARELYQKAADKQYALAFYLLGILDIIDAPKQSFEFFKRGAELGSREAAFMLGHCYEDQKNVAEAVRWFKFAAEQGHREAQFVFAGYLKSGKGTKQDLGLAKEYYEKAAQQAHPLAAEAM